MNSTTRDRKPKQRGAIEQSTYKEEMRFLLTALPRANTKRISISLPSELLTAFNKALKKTGYSDRSKGMQVAIRTFLSENEWTGDDGFGAGTLVILYDPEVEGIESWTTKVQHDHTGLINATMHIHLNEHNCLEAIMVKGSVSEIKHLAKKLSEERGVKNIKVHFVKLV